MSVRTLPSILMNLCMQIFLTSSPVRAYFSRLRRKMMRGRHSLSLCGPVDGRGACGQKLSAGGSSSINRPRKGNNGANSARKSMQGQQQKMQLPRRQRPAAAVFGIHSSLPHVLPASQNCPQQSTTIHLNPEAEKHRKQLKRIANDPITSSANEGKRTLFTKTPTLNKYLLPCPTAPVHRSPQHSTRTLPQM